MKLCLTVLLLTLICPFSYAANIEEGSQKISALLKTATYQNNPSMEIVGFNYKPESRSESNFKGKVAMTVEEGWRTNLTIKNLSAERMICTVTGRFKLSNGKFDASSESELFHGHIDPGAEKEYTSGFVANLKTANKFVSYSVKTECEPVEAIDEGNKDARVLNLLKTAKYKKDVGIKVIEANFSKIGSDKYWDTWETTIKIKSCYTTKMECSASGRWETTDDSINTSQASNPYYGVLPLAYIEKQSSIEGRGVIKVRKEYIDMLSSFKIALSCDPVYSEHPNKYPPNHKYWKQFLPKNNECK